MAFKGCVRAIHAILSAVAADGYDEVAGAIIGISGIETEVFPACGSIVEAAMEHMHERAVELKVVEHCVGGAANINVGIAVVRPYISIGGVEADGNDVVETGKGGGIDNRCGHRRNRGHEHTLGSWRGSAGRSG